MPVKVAIVGATGYAGGELARLLLRHPEARLVATVARGRQGEALRDVQPHLHSAPASLTVGADPGDAEVVFTALPAGEAAKLAPAWLAEGRSVIDIGSDFRLLSRRTTIVVWITTPRRVLRSDLLRRS